MKPDYDLSDYVECEGAAFEFTKEELLHLRYLQRRLTYLETQVATQGGMSSGSGGGLHAELEINALVYALTELDFLEKKER